MIQSGGWCGIRTRDEHTKLSRIELSFSPIFDNAFKINVAKMRVQLPIQIKDQIETVIGPAVRLARDHYDGEKKASPNSVQSKNLLQSQETDKKDTIYGIETQKFTIGEIEEKVISIASEEEKSIIKQLFLRLRIKLFGKER